MISTAGSHPKDGDMVVITQDIDSRPLGTTRPSRIQLLDNDGPVHGTNVTLKARWSNGASCALVAVTGTRSTRSPLTSDLRATGPCSRGSQPVALQPRHHTTTGVRPRGPARLSCPPSPPGPSPHDGGPHAHPSEARSRPSGAA